MPFNDVIDHCTMPDVHTVYARPCHLGPIPMAGLVAFFTVLLDRASSLFVCASPDQFNCGLKKRWLAFYSDHSQLSAQYLPPVH